LTGINYPNSCHDPTRPQHAAAGRSNDADILPDGHVDRLVDSPMEARR
jgi:hypothetical protein